MNEHRGLWRGKHINNKEHNGEWVEGFLCPEKYTGFSLPGGVDYYIITCPYGGGRAQIQVDPSTLGECTGLTDKNGKLIFEGDIIEHKSKRYVIKYIEKYMRFSPVKPGTVFAVFDYTQSEIIGNIHDNPELLKATGEDIGNAAQDTIAPAT